MFLKSSTCSVFSTAGFRPGLDHLFTRVFYLTANIFSLIPVLPQFILRLLLKNEWVRVTILKNHYWHSFMHGTHAKLLTYCVSVGFSPGPSQPTVPAMTYLLFRVCTQASFSVFLNTLSPFSHSAVPYVWRPPPCSHPADAHLHSEIVFWGLLLMNYAFLWALIWVYLYIFFS